MGTLNNALSPIWLTKTAFSTSIGTLCPTKDNKILVFGESDHERGDFNIGRLTSSGAIDLTFNGKGFIEHEFPKAEGSLFLNPKAFVQDDGKIFLVGTLVEAEMYPAAARFDSTGAADTDFGEKGFAVFKDQSGTNQEALAAAKSKSKRAKSTGANNLNAFRLPDEGYLIASAETGYLLKLDESGALNSDFGDGGYLLPRLNDKRVIELQSAMVLGEHILVVGYVGASGYVARFHLSGALDTDFGKEGSKPISRTDANFVRLTGLSSRPNISLSIAGFAHTTENKNGALLTRLNTAGAIDEGFNKGKPVLLNPAGRQADARHVTTRRDDHVYIVGQTTFQDGSDPRFYAAAYRADGTLDNDFTSGGWGLGPERSTGMGMYLDAQNNLLICGTARDASNNYEGIVACYKPNAS
ncbi:delta-60 repeat domain-containing protein [Pseudomonas sp. H9]|uniref:delta-60 repeat domain-containing protein n=1 Tax=Pseudomonas sp. H9 TaxID=483968 RepID=UPI0010577AF7|nr:delta-60 repeat domain-containing protein [Pseudomonas sp. H9]TDF85136.1 hypothetical protein E1573_05705 [Pseudomonas sp. H9]